MNFTKLKKYWTPHHIELLLLAMTLLATVVISGLTLRQTTRHFEITTTHYEIERTSAFVARFNSLEMVELREEVDRWLESKESPAQLYDRSIGTPVDPATANPNSTPTAQQALRTVSKLRTMANYFQEFGTAFRADSLNKRYAHELLGSVCVRYAILLEPFIIETRKRRQRPQLYAEVFLLKSRMEALDKEPQ